MYVPRYMVFTKGVGVAKEKLSSFENALREARIAHLNLVTVSSIFPPHCNIIDIEKGIDRLEPGEITHCVMAREQINEPGRRIVASIGLAKPVVFRKVPIAASFSGQGKADAGDNSASGFVDLFSGHDAVRYFTGLQTINSLFDVNDITVWGENG
jgi:arginine decarboxylase